MSIQVLNQVIGNGSANAVILGGGGLAPYTTQGAAVPPTEVGYQVTLNLTNVTGGSFTISQSPDYKDYLAGLITAPTWSPIGEFNNSSQLTVTGGTAITGIDSAVTTFTVAISGSAALKVQQSGAFGGSGTPLVSIKSLSTLAPIQVLPPLAPVATAFLQTIIMPFQLVDFANAAAYAIGIPFNFTLKSALFRTGKPATTGSKLATLTLSTTAGAVTGGVMALTSANQTPAGSSVAATAISGANATSTAGTSVIATASSVTAFVEGDGWIELTVQNNDLATSLTAV